MPIRSNHVPLRTFRTDVSAGGKDQYTGEIILTAEQEDANGKDILHVDAERAAQLYDPEKQPQQNLDPPQYKKR